MYEESESTEVIFVLMNPSKLADLALIAV